MGSGAIAQIVSAIQNDQIYNFRDQQESAKIPSSALRHFLRVLLLQPSGPSGGATIKPPGAVKLGVGAELRPAASLGVALGGKWGRGGRARACL